MRNEIEIDNDALNFNIKEIFPIGNEINEISLALITEPWFKKVYTKCIILLRM